MSSIFVMTGSLRCLVYRDDRAMVVWSEANLLSRKRLTDSRSSGNRTLAVRHHHLSSSSLRGMSVWKIFKQEEVREHGSVYVRYPVDLRSRDDLLDC